MNNKNPHNDGPSQHDSIGENDEHARMLDLMIQRATSGLSDSEQMELNQLVSLSEQHQQSSASDELEKIELTAAAVDVSLIELEKMPDAIRDSVLFDAGRHFKTDPTAFETNGNGNSSSAASSPAADLPTKVERSPRKSQSGMTWREILALTVTAASLFLLLSGWNPFSLSAAQKMARLIDSNPADLVKESWVQVDKNYAGASGKVVWSDEAQEGYMVFTGIKPNDPSIEQFQLWIFDNDPAQEHPVDGGVFDIAASEQDADGQVIVPIKLHIPVKHAVQFAVTVEQPGGVTVSKRERIPVLAKLASVN